MGIRSPSRVTATSPWAELPASPPFVLSCDETAISSFNRRASERHHVHLDALPEPFIGDPLAPIVMLNLNPGFHPRDPEVHARPDAAALIRANLEHRGRAFYYFDSVFDDSPGGEWWRQRLGPLIRATNKESVETSVFVVEAFGYHSVSWKPGCHVPSQRYSERLVQQALARQAVIICMRAKQQWLSAVPELNAYPLFFGLNSVQNVTVSERNCPAGWGHLVERLT
jgi:hypothetical protein